MNLIIRADANSAIGVGHVMRCIALAQRWHGQVQFVSGCTAGTLTQLIRSQGFEFHYVADSHTGWDSIATIALRSSAQAIVFDGYDFNAADFHRASSLGLTVVAIDDNAHLSEYPVDILVNQNPYAASLSYKTPRETTRLLGSEFALVRREFADAATYRDSVGETPTVLVTMGGSDPANVTPVIIEAIKRIRGVSVVIVAGVANPATEQLLRMIGGNPRITLEPSVLDMSRLMTKADIVITAAGSTCWECCCLGAPMLTVVTAENQCKNAEFLASANACVNLGWHEDLTVDAIVEKLEMLLADSEVRSRISSNGKQLVDGKGASRVAETIADHVGFRKGSIV
jgi:UDP-2,4-diacetamido-2,4,6-trideoxy-beta-L-altropyranose hydrolase